MPFFTRMFSAIKQFAFFIFDVCLIGVLPLSVDCFHLYEAQNKKKFVRPLSLQSAP